MTAITVIGGTGYAGAAIVAEAARRGHTVTAISRTAPGTQAEGVEYVTGDLTQSVPDIAGAEVVVAALSPRGDNAGKLRDAYRSLAQAAATNGARFVGIGGFSSLRPAEGAPRFVEGDDLPPEFAAEAREMNDILTDLATGSVDVDWLFVSPAAEFGSHAPGEALGRYRVSGEVALFDQDGKSAISGADFARAVLDEIETPTRHRAQIHFAY
ncbi:NAD(P)-dependent oxidoreductase [Micrococcus luteus]|uniref:NAD(P)-dependent oxidoreductase n=1 Tax=Micrococcus luteus TaxID=1270 RepID=UPI0020061FA8|nr:NAD(P)H-binding protein [Micrococcus luteus]MCK6058041.1 NAD(P)H-binding protein [Micrococcus luteus]MCK6061277.1 NAD(P)H-binding protein [Micrococcus luteus]MCK6063556.1 NAD(P)H-binding protein [Micrococcus luteus]MCK6192752.1 NAD(P)H-binding protein [Micrococcus luteus]MCK6193862.1 NAD(P)H-binding protein [Micrococcus luteus]